MPQKLAPISAAVIVLLLGAGLAGIVAFFLRYCGAQLVISAGLVVASLFVASSVHRCLYRMSTQWALIVAVLMLAAVVAPVVLSIAVGRITYARFGLTVYGLLPVPALDVTINENGVLWFRPKNHLAEFHEVQRLLSDDVDVLVIGTGWEQQMRVEESIRHIENVDVRIEPTPEAFRVFNLLRSEGKRVVLLAHGTC